MDLEQFYTDFNFAQTVDEKRKMIDNLNTDDDFSEEELKELYEQINDVVQNLANEEDSIISLEIEEGKYSLYTCIKSFDSYKVCGRYYVKVDDPKYFYLSTGIGETNSVIKNMIESIKPIYYIVTDDGIGTLKRKNIFPNELDFSEYFIKFV